MKAWVKKTLNGLLPASRTDEEKLQSAKLKLGEYYQIELKKPRNIRFHRKFFSLLNLAFDNQSDFNCIEDFRGWVTMRSGYYRKVPTPTGEYYTPKSISFSKMDQIEFNEFYDRVFSFILEYLGCEDEELYEQLKDY